MKNTSQIRATFLDFFAKNGHEVRASSSLVPHNDPTLMFTNAGMNQFKNVFTGVEKLPFLRAATSQKCVRAGGKHNDLDNVGYTARHHTFFEMLGNFSFGDYFKEDAIRLAWELLTKEYGIDKSKLYFTVYHTDDEAFNLWKKITGCDDTRILRVPTKDNFWSMGDTGPCGPCSEIFYDHGERAGDGVWALDKDGHDRFGSRFVEIWNLVFMQYEQVDAETRLNLPKPSIDTGMGLERIAAVMQGVFDNYDIDLFKAIINDIKQQVVKSGGKIAPEEAPYKVIADHLRSCSFLFADGVMPSNEGRGYVLRRIMRRAMRYAHQLGCNEPLMYKLVPSLIAQMGEQYPELKRAEATIISNLREEEERFKETLGRGLKLLEEESSNLNKGQKLKGDAAFKLYDTYGFPLDLTQDILKARGIEVDVDGFDKAMENQREMARAAHKGSGDVATGKIWFALKEKIGATKFLGYEQDEAEAKVLAIVKDGAEVKSAHAGDEVFVVLDQTPFYGEWGGQVGDTGFFKSLVTSLQSPENNPLLATSDLRLATILDTQKPLEDFIVHKAKILAPLKVGDAVGAKIDSELRDKTRANHSATHLLHKALRDLLGEHVTQKGSLVDPERLRFDFSHPKALTEDERAQIAQTVNEVVLNGGEVACVEMSPEDAIKAGAMALFGEKYGERVRVLSMGVKDTSPKAQSPKPNPYSIELCGGTHVKNTSDIGLFAITSEGSVASGIRRIEAVTGEGVRAYFIAELHKQNELLEKLEQDNHRQREELALPPHPHSTIAEDALTQHALADLPTVFLTARDAAQTRITQLQEENKKLAKQLAETKKQQALGDSKVTAEKIGNISFIGKIFDGLDPKDLRGVAEDYLKQIEPGIVVVATNTDGKASVVVGVDQFLTDLYNAATLVQAAVAVLGGKGGGGKPTLAQGGGPNVNEIEKALQTIKTMIG